MSRQLLGKVMAGAGLGAASLLICAPGTALADDAPWHEQNKGHIYTEPKGVKPGHKFKVFLKCEEPVDKPWVSSKVTGKLWLKPVEEHDYRAPERPRTPENGDQPENGGQPNGGQPNGGQPNGGQPNGGQPNGGQPNGGQPNGGQPNGGQPNGGGTQPPLPNGGGEQPPLPNGGAQPGGGQPQGGGGGSSPYGDEEGSGESRSGEDGYSGESSGGDSYGGESYGEGVEYWAWATVPWKTKPGHYEAKGACHAEGKIVVLPSGWVHGGDGGATTDQTRTLAGAGMLGAAAIGGFLMIRRRRTDGSLA